MVAKNKKPNRPETVPVYLNVAVDVDCKIMVPLTAVLESTSEDDRTKQTIEACRQQLTAEQIHKALQALTVDDIKQLSNGGAGVKVNSAGTVDDDEYMAILDGDDTPEELQADLILGCTVQASWLLYDTQVL